MTLFAGYSLRADIPVPDETVNTLQVPLEEQSLFFEPCCHHVSVNYNLVDSCCVEISAYNYSCNANFKFEYFNPVTQQYETKHIEGVYDDTVKFIICPENGESVLKFRVAIVDPGNENHYWCTYNDLDEEGWNVFTFETDASQCCDCPDSSFNSWFKTTVGPNPDCPDGCKVHHELNIPPNINCFKYYYYDNAPLGIFFGNNPQNLQTEPLTMYDTCITIGQLSYGELYLLRYIDDPNPCILRDSARCDTVPPEPILPLPCDQSCADSVWKYYNPIDLTLTSCPGCQLKIFYKARKKCDGKQQLEILRIEYQNEYSCSGCSEWFIMRQSLLKVIATNDMGFEPLNENECDTTWQVGNGSCWASFYEYYLKIQEFDPTNPNPFFELDSVLVRQKCDSVDCCIRNYTVCKYANSIRVYSQIGDNDPILCDYKSLKDPWGNYHLCEPNCEWMDFDTIWTQNLIVEKSVSITEQNNIKLNIFNLSNNILYLPILESFHAEYISIYDLLGNRVKQIIINKRNQITEFDLSDLNNGIYLFIISDGKEILQTGKFSKVE